MRDAGLGFQYCIQNKGSHFSPQEGVEGGAPLTGDFRVIVCLTTPQINDFCDLLGTPYAPVSKIAPVKGQNFCSNLQLYSLQHSLKITILVYKQSANTTQEKIPPIDIMNEKYLTTYFFEVRKTIQGQIYIPTQQLGLLAVDNQSYVDALFVILYYMQSPSKS